MRLNLLSYDGQKAVFQHPCYGNLGTPIEAIVNPARPNRPEAIQHCKDFIAAVAKTPPRVYFERRAKGGVQDRTKLQIGRLGSYSLKHCVSRWLRGIDANRECYISEYEFICAALELGVGVIWFRKMPEGYGNNFDFDFAEYFKRVPA